MDVITLGDRPRRSSHLLAEGVARADNTDRGLLCAAALGDEGAWARLVEEHAEHVWTVVRSNGLLLDEAAAVCELVWLRLAEALPDVGPGGLDAWLSAVAVVEAEHAQVRAGRPPARPWGSRERRRHPRQRSG